MLPLPKGKSVVCIVGIDPGTTKPGLCLLYYDVVSKRIVKVVSRVLSLEKYTRNTPYLNYQTDRFLRLKAFDNIIRDVLRTERPIRVGSEVPFINIKRPGAVIPLAECLSITENAVYDHDPYMTLDRIEPSLVKKAVGVKGNSGDKHAMTEAIAKIPQLADNILGNLFRLDNNAVDSTAVAFATLLKEIGPNGSY